MCLQSPLLCPATFAIRCVITFASGSWCPTQPAAGFQGIGLPSSVLSPVTFQTCLGITCAESSWRSVQPAGGPSTRSWTSI